MSISQDLYAAAEWMRKHGFSPDWKLRGRGNKVHGPGCFVNAIDHDNTDDDHGETYAWFLRTMFSDAKNFDDVATDEDWTTDDAVAALTIAAQIAEAEGA